MSSSSIALNPPEVFNGENYQMWSVKMQSYLEAFDLWEVVTKDRPVPPLPKDPTMAQIKFNNEEKSKKSKANTLIQNSVKHSVFYKIMACKTTKEAWDRLKEEYQGSDRTRQMQVLNLKRDFESPNMKEDETITRCFDRISLIVNNVIRLLGEDFPAKRIVEKVLVTLLERFESKISSLEESKNLSEIPLAELMNALQAQEQRRTFRQDKITEGAFYMQRQQAGTGKKNFNNKNKNNSCEFPPCAHYSKTTHLEKYCWWRPNAMCGKCKQLGHIAKVCKFKNKDCQSQQAQIADEVYTQEEQLF